MNSGEMRIGNNNNGGGNGLYDISMLLYLYDEELGGSPFQYIRGSYDVIAPGEIQGRQLTRFMDSNMDFVLDDKGSLTLSNP